MNCLADRVCFPEFWVLVTLASAGVVASACLELSSEKATEFCLEGLTGSGLGFRV